MNVVIDENIDDLENKMTGETVLTTASKDEEEDHELERAKGLAKGGKLT